MLNTIEETKDISKILQICTILQVASSIQKDTVSVSQNWKIVLSMDDTVIIIIIIITITITITTIMMMMIITITIEIVIVIIIIII